MVSGAVDGKNEEGSCVKETESHANGLVKKRRRSAQRYRNVSNILTFNSWNFVRRTTVLVSTPSRLKLFKKEGKTHKMGKNQTVRHKLPRLPAKKVYASHFRRFARVKIVVRGITIMATHEPQAQSLK
jgi:hypothetical protein